MKALLAGFGGIGANVHYSEMKALGYDVDILDIKTPEAKYKSMFEIEHAYDLAVVSTPNYTHKVIASHLATHGTKRIFVEKPGVADAGQWLHMCESHPNTQFHLVKNNLYRENYGEIFELIKQKTLIGIDINWLNDNRIPNPGSWFTTKKLAFGGISRDLMPHLYCFALKIMGEEKIMNAAFFQGCYQRWGMHNITSTDYGVVTSGGIYDVDDIAQAATTIDDVSIRLTASWKEGYDKQSITLFFKDGTTYEWDFGLCPAAAYGKMLQDTKDTTILDTAIHTFLDNFL